MLWPMEAEGLLGTKLVFGDNVLEVFSHGKSSVRLMVGSDIEIERNPFGDGMRVNIRVPGGGKMLAFSAEQKRAADALLDAFEAAGRAPAEP
jgi:hypothetical protein